MCSQITVRVNGVMNRVADSQTVITYDHTVIEAMLMKRLRYGWNFAPNFDGLVKNCGKMTRA
jgi:hypothetical protein